MDGVLLSTVPLHPLVCVLCGWVGVKGRSVLDGGTLSEWERDMVSGSLPGSSDGIMQWLAAQPASVDCWHTDLSVTYTHTCILRIDHTLCEIQASNLALASLHLYMYVQFHMYVNEYLFIECCFVLFHSLNLHLSVQFFIGSQPMHMQHKYHKHICSSICHQQ